MPNQKTIIVVTGEPEIRDDHLMRDQKWKAAVSIDGNFDIPPVEILVRWFKKCEDGNGRPTLPLEVYIGGAYPLYPTLVYQDNELICQDPGLLWKGKKG